MARTFLLFDFGTDEEAVRKARLRIEAWKQAFRLGNKMQFKVERPGENSQERKGRGKERAAEGETLKPIRLIVRLDFSAHEKHLSQTWLDRIPSEEPFKSVKLETIPMGAGNFDPTAELFDSLD
ncbi:MAG TPA: hypothetical protein VGS59_15115 [Candidatus Acidoferrales bacterium]|nr:hypothetical protein [Candidatus Acidoferrales bacterium]